MAVDEIAWHNFTVMFPHLYRWLSTFARYSNELEAFEFSFLDNKAFLKFSTRSHKYQLDAEAPTSNSHPGHLALYFEGDDTPLVAGFYRQEVWNRILAEIAARELQPQKDAQD